MRRLVVVGLMLVALTGCSNASSTPTNRITINGHELEVELARTPADRQRGLSGRDTLAHDTGMLFLFDQPTTGAFWMKDMRFPIDIIWIANDRIVGITPNVPVPTTTPLLLYAPPEPVTSVLETNAGWGEEYAITVGGRVELKR